MTRTPNPNPVERSIRLSKGRDFELLTIEEVGKELSRQDSSKVYRGDSIHMQAVKALADTSLLPALTHLFNSYLDEGYTLAAREPPSLHKYNTDRPSPTFLA